MHRVKFVAYGHENVVSEHKTTLELTTENFLTPQGTCIICVRATQKLCDLSYDIKKMARSKDTQILLRMSVDGEKEEVIGRGSPGLTYENPVSMVARTSTFECGRTLMVNADKAASDLSRRFIQRLTNPSSKIYCELVFISE